MTTAEKITAGIALLAALGVGALLQAWVTHLLHRRERKINIADKSVQIAETLMTRMEAELTRAQQALATVRQESDELRVELAKAVAVGQEVRQRDDVRRRLREFSTSLAGASDAVGSVQLKVRVSRAEIIRYRRRQPAGRTLVDLHDPVPTPPPVDEDVWADMVDQHGEDEHRQGRG
ncbi:hypothetical protein ACQP2H_24175 [Micromonospora sp. CA-248260]|uniref:hypothetical protein n=1 Tax=Micromonospora sp. CA-248260 TaxID=3239962 RepID=UPI003D8FBABC